MIDMKKALQNIDDVIKKGPYKDTWASLSSWQTPKWYQKAKFGIFIHWGVYSVPAFDSEWYPRNMYIEGSKVYEHHIKTYGAHKDFGYKDFIPMFKAEKFDPNAWAALFKKAGAKYVVPVAEHHDGFQMYRSNISHWNAYEMGPKRDIVGELKAAVEHGKISEADVDARLDELLELPGFMGFQTNNEVATGLGFGARKGNSVVQALLRDYDALDFLKADGSADLTPCPERNTRVLQALGVRKDGTRQSIAEMEIFPAEYFCPMDLYSRELRVTPKTYSIHRYAESWKPKPSAVSRILQRLLKKHYYTWYCPLRGRIEGRLRKRT